MTVGQDQHATGRLIASRYRLREALGRGGMGTVWLADDTLLRRQVAVKELRFPASVGDEERAILRERSLREARAAARLDSPHVVRIYDVVDEGGAPCIVMELLRGRTLAQIVRTAGPLSPAEVARIGSAVTDALVVAHAAGVVHRDVKPGNVFVTDGGRVVLTDFGIAMSAGDPTITETGLLVGSPAYMAPERARGVSPTAASDVWSLGATLYTAVEGRAPFDAGDPVGTLTSVVSDDPYPMRRAGPLAPLLEGLLAKDPAARPPTTELAGMLATVASRAADLAATAPLPAEPYPVERPYGTDVERTTVLRVVDSAAGTRIERASAGASAAGTAARGAATAGAAPPGGASRASAPSGMRPATATAGRPAPPGGPVRGAAPVPPTSRPPTFRPPTPPEPPTPRRPPADDEPTDRRRTVVALLAVALAVVGAIAVALTGLHGGSDRAGSPSASAKASRGARATAAPLPTGGGSGATTPGGSAGSGGTAPATGSASGSGAASGSTGSGHGTGTGTGTSHVSVPAGWQRSTSPEGWSLFHPLGWTVNRHVVRGQTVTDFQSNTGELVRVNITPTPFEQPIDDWRSYEPTFAATAVGYQRLALRALTVDGDPAADWEFLYSAGGTALHALDREIRAGEVTYAVLFQSHAEDWSSVAADRDAILASFRPAG